MFDVYFWSVAAFFAVLVALIYRDRKNLEFHKFRNVPVMVMKKTTRGKKLLDRVALSSPTVTKIWNVLATISILVAFAAMVYGMYMITLSAYYVLIGEIDVPAVQFVLPIPQSQPITGMGFIGVPFWFWILIIPFVLFPHEFAHGVIARANGIRIKTVGLIQLLIWPGGFVEPDERQIKRSSLMKQLRIFCIGSIANITISVVIISLAHYLLWPAFIPEGILLTDVVEGSGAEAAGLKPGMVIQEIAGSEINVDYGDFSLIYNVLLFRGNITTDNFKGLSTSVEIRRALIDTEPGQTIAIRADNSVRQLTLSGRPENASLPFIGIEATIVTKNDTMIEFTFPLIWWLTNIALLVALFNILPIYPLDGGLMVEAIAKRLNKKYAKKITMGITLLVTAVLVFSFIWPIIT
jgi:membrane-associated protease RseP (regulator of RpoE activity)